MVSNTNIIQVAEQDNNILSNYAYDPKKAYQNIVDFLWNRATDKNKRTRIKTYMTWIEDEGHDLLKAELDQFRDKLLANGMKAESVSVYLTEIRNIYKALISQRDLLFQVFPPSLPWIERKGYVDELVIRIMNSIDPSNTRVNVTKSQDAPDIRTLRLNQEQVANFLLAPGLSTLTSVRDTAIIAMFLATGCREGELVSAQVEDLSQSFGGEVAFHIRHGKGNKERLVPYGDLINLMEFVNLWLDNSGIQDGFVFRRIFRGGKKVGFDALSTYAIQLILKKYPIKSVAGREIQVRPHDLRRTYAKHAYQAAMDIYKLQLNLGHKSEQTTKHYIGTLSAKERRPGNIYGDLATVLDREDV